MTDQLLEACAKAFQDSHGVHYSRLMAEKFLAIARPIIERECYEKAAKVCEEMATMTADVDCYAMTRMCAKQIRHIAMIPSDAGQQRGAGE